tara:strand:+ start:29 stop:955 length:927 start_codon:yes stop_codon:yes gene_type:complete
MEDLPSMTASFEAAAARGASAVQWGERRGFLKVGTGGESASTAMLEYEAMGLRHMRAAAAGALTIPEVWHVGALPGDGGGFIVMDALELGRCGRAHQAALGAGLYAMHAAPPHAEWTGRFGFPMDGCCGAGPQPNNAEGRALNWAEFWSEYRLGSMLARLKTQLRPSAELARMQALGSELQTRLLDFFEFPIEDVQPALLHGDLWSGNVGLDRLAQRPAIYDPACYYGHAEADFGISRMFGGLASEALAAYGSAAKAAGASPQAGRCFEQRAKLYELHHHLNHACIFGDGYLSGCVGLAQALLKPMPK